MNGPLMKTNVKNAIDGRIWVRGLWGEGGGAIAEDLIFLGNYVIGIAAAGTEVIVAAVAADIRLGIVSGDGFRRTLRIRVPLIGGIGDSIVARLMIS